MVVNETYKDRLMQTQMHPHHYDELRFLRFFYYEVNGALGPASDDIYEMIMDAWETVGNVVPEGYREEEEDG